MITSANNLITVSVKDHEPDYKKWIKFLQRQEKIAFKQQRNLQQQAAGRSNKKHLTLD